MPLVVINPTLTPPTPPPPPPVPPPPPPAVGTIRATWTAPDGTEWDLSHPDPDHGWLTTAAIAGWGANPIELIVDPVARGGEQVRHIRSLPRRLIWPLHIHGEAAGHVTHLRFLDRYRSLMHAFTQTTQKRAPGVLRVARPDGSAREIDGFYETGFGGEPGENWVFANVALTLYCPDGYWRGTEPLTVQRGYSAGVPFLRPFMTVSSSRVLGQSQITNPGEVDAWPDWTITGPATAVTATNHTAADAQFTLTYDLAAGQQITITTLRPTVRGPTGQNLTGSLDWPACELWPLLPGINDVEFQVSGSGTGTGITLEYYPRFEAA